ncbi:MAG: DNA-binding protein [Clostridiaceae bacterium BRH_c20a]|nr:MAG: DNA-binding protein [Clostridiaceae bacterium BRH_c20a]
MKKVEISAKTVEEAIKLALQQLELQESEVNVEILEQPNKGLFGFFGNKNAVVSVEEKFNHITSTKIFLENILKKIGLNPKIEVVESNDYITFNLSGDDLGILIGRRGDTLDSLQFLTNLAVNKNHVQRKKIIIDVEDYRNRREETLINLANRLSEKVKRTGRKVILEPMNPHERRIIHVTLQNNIYISTYSEGDEPYRKVVIVPKN